MRVLVQGVVIGLALTLLRADFMSVRPMDSGRTSGGGGGASLATERLYEGIHLDPPREGDGGMKVDTFAMAELDSQADDLPATRFEELFHETAVKMEDSSVVVKKEDKKPSVVPVDSSEMMEESPVVVEKEAEPSVRPELTVSFVEMEEPNPDNGPRTVEHQRTFMEPFALRAINAVRPDTFAFGDSDTDDNLCAPKNVSQKVWGNPRALDYIVPLDDAEWPQNCQGREDLCAVLRRVARNREVLAAVANSQAPGLTPFLEMLIALKVPNFLVIALDKALTERLDGMHVPYYFYEDPVTGNHKVSAKKFALIQEFVSVGCSVLLTDTDVTYQQNPFMYLYRDSDIESMSDGFDNESANGFLQTIDDPTMGAARKRAASYRVAALNSGMWYVSATEASLRLMKIMAHRMATEDLWDQSGYNLELWFASRDAHMTSGATVRIMNPYCFMNSKVMFRIIRHTEQLQREKHRPVAMHANYHTDKDNKIRLVHAYYTQDTPLSTLECSVGCDSDLKTIIELESNHLHTINDAFVGSKNWKSGRAGAKTCKPLDPWNGDIDGLARRLHVVDNSEGVCLNASKLKTTAKQICEALAKITPNERGDVVLVVASADDSEALKLLLKRGIKKNGLEKQTLVVTSDAAIEEIATLAGVVAVRRTSSKVLPSATLKWYAIHTILRDGRGVVNVAPSVTLLHDPSDSFYYDSDIESASDGWDDTSAYGYDHVVDDPSMEWSRYLHGGRVASSDAGFFRLAPTTESVSLAERVMTRLTGLGDTATNAEEQDVFNAAVFFPSYGSAVSVGVMRRTLNYLCFPNSKTLFLFMRKDKGLASHAPVMIDFSYHPGDVERMKSAYDYYEELSEGKLSEKSKKAFMRIPVADGAKTSDAMSDVSTLCALKASTPTEEEVSKHALASRLIDEVWTWGGTKPLVFKKGGELKTPWGAGKWSLVRDGANTSLNAIWADFVGAHHLLNFETPEGSADANTMFVAERCADGNLVIGRRVVDEA